MSPFAPRKSKIIAHFGFRRSERRHFTAALAVSSKIPYDTKGVLRLRLSLHSADHGMSIPLHLLAAGEHASIDQLLGPPAEIHRLEELGLRVGRAIEMVQSGTPCIVRLEGAKLCFRQTEGCHILVRPAA